MGYPRNPYYYNRTFRVFYFLVMISVIHRELSYRFENIRHQPGREDAVYFLLTDPDRILSVSFLPVPAHDDRREDAKFEEE